jgi:hypothetical protein
VLLAAEDIHLHNEPTDVREAKKDPIGRNGKLQCKKNWTH